MRWIVIVLAVLNVLAGVVVFVPLNDPNNPLLFGVSVILLCPSIAAASLFVNGDFYSRGYRGFLFIAGWVQAGVILWMYYLIKRWVHRIMAPRRRMGIR